jgi:hypothetical protein
LSDLVEPTGLEAHWQIRDFFGNPP